MAFILNFIAFSPLDILQSSSKHFHLIKANLYLKVSQTLYFTFNLLKSVVILEIIIFRETRKHIDMSEKGSITNVRYNEQEFLRHPCI